MDRHLPRAAVGQHVREMPLETVVRPRLDGDADTLGLALLAELDCLRY